MSDRRPLAHVIQRLTNRALACTEDHAVTIVAALRSELNVNLIMTVEGERLDPQAMDKIAAAGRSKAAAKLQQRGERYKLFTQVDNIAVIPIAGTLMKNWGLEPYSGCTGYDGIKTKLIAALEDDSVDGIWLEIDSPGGEVGDMLDLSDAIYASSERHRGGKPIWAIADDRCASAAFCLGTAADKLIATRIAMTGSVGVVAVYTNIRLALENEGIRVKIYRAGERKMRLNDIEDPDEETENKLQAELDMIRGMFVETAARNLAIDSKKVAQTEGRTYIGDQARAIGFISAVMSWDQAWTKFTRYLENR